MIEQLHEIIRQVECEWACKRVLVVGDLMLDKYVWGEVGRISPEAPVPVVRITHLTQQPGGAANVAMNLARLGAQPILAGFTGNDENERLLEAELRGNCITPMFVANQAFPTITKQRIMGGRQQMLRLDTEKLSERPQGDYDLLMQYVLCALPDCHVVVLSDYAKGTLNPAVCQQVIRAARNSNIPVLVDPKNADFDRYGGATTICPNLGELSQALRMEARNVEGLLARAEQMVQNLDIDFLTVTLSEKGIAVVREGTRFIAPAKARQVFDVSGAGDTVIAVLALCLASGLRPETSIQLANLAAGIVVGKVGTVPVEKHELLAALSPELSQQATEKVVSRADLLRRIAWWRANGERVVFTNGCFDLIHVGHITVLEQARTFGDRLIVAINSDRSVRELKGPSRPIVGEKERGRVLAALTAVDAVVAFDETTPLELILAAKPDVIVKGADYKSDMVVGAREVESWGGQVKIVPIVEGFSTTQLIGKATEN